MRTEFLCISILRVASGPRVKLASCKSALNPPVVCSTDRSKAVVPVLVLLFVALWFILRGDLLYVFPCVILFLCFSVLLVLRLPRLGKRERELILVLFVRLFGLCLFRFVGFLFLLGSGKGCGLWLWHSLDFSLTSFMLHHPSLVQLLYSFGHSCAGISCTNMHCRIEDVLWNSVWRKSCDIVTSSHWNILYGYSLEAPRRGSSNGYPQHIKREIRKKSQKYCQAHLLKKSSDLRKRKSCYNRFFVCVFANKMQTLRSKR